MCKPFIKNLIKTIRICFGLLYHKTIKNFELKVSYSIKINDLEGHNMHNLVNMSEAVP